MFEIIRRDDGERAATFWTDPFETKVLAAAGDGLRQVLDEADDLEEWNITEYEGEVAYPPEDPDSDEDTEGTSMEGLEAVTPDMKVRHIARTLKPGYIVRPGPDVQASEHWTEGDKIETEDGTRGIVVEVRTSNFEGPDGDEVEASEDSPAYIIATQDGAEAVTGDELTASDWSAGQESPDKDLADHVAGGDAEARLEAGPTDWDYPPSWRKSEIPSRLILLDAWSSMGAQFDCGGGCCKGTMLESGMSDRASDQFCASMKDRVLLWEGWRQGG